MPAIRSGTSLCEVLLALVIIAMSASWSLQATAATEHAVGVARARADAMQRASFELAALQALPCDTARSARIAAEPRWHLQATRTALGTLRKNDVVLATRRADTIRTTSYAWCSQ